MTQEVTTELHSALYSISPEDRDTWVMCGMAIHSELGDAGYDLWDGWSRGSQKYKQSSARSVWRSFKHPSNGVKIGSVYHLAKDAGWTGNAPVHPQISSEDRYRLREETRKADKRQRMGQMAAANMAYQMIGMAEYIDPRPSYRNEFNPPTAHPYLISKGFPDQGGLVFENKLLVPMRHYGTSKIQSVQTIDSVGNKRYLQGGRAGHAVHKLWNSSYPTERWYCEGYATGLSIMAALKSLYRDSQSEVWVCFMASNLPKVVERRPNSFVIADHDSSGVGQKYAEQTGLPFWMPPDPDTDANDYMLKYSVQALASRLREVIND